MRQTLIGGINLKIISQIGKLRVRSGGAAFGNINSHNDAFVGQSGSCGLSMIQEQSPKWKKEAGQKDGWRLIVETGS